MERDRTKTYSGHVEPCVGQSADRHTETGGFFPDAYNLTPLKGEKTESLLAIWDLASDLVGELY